VVVNSQILGNAVYTICQKSGNNCYNIVTITYSSKILPKYELSKFNGLECDLMNHEPKRLNYKLVVVPPKK